MTDVKRIDESTRAITIDADTRLFGWQNGGAEPSNHYDRDHLDDWFAESLAGRGPLLSITPPPTVASLSWLNQGAATATEYDQPSGRAISLRVPAGTGLNIRGLYTAAANGNITAFLQPTRFSEAYNNFAIFVRDNNDKIVRFGAYYDALAPWRWFVGLHNTPTSVASSPLDAHAGGSFSPESRGVWLRIDHRASTRFFECSYDGAEWLTLLSHASGTHLVPTSAGFQGESQGTGASPVSVVCHSLLVS